MIQIDHVVIAVEDLAAAEQSFLDDHGLASVPGDDIPFFGLQTSWIPLRGDYLELMAVTDERRARASGEGRVFLDHLANGTRYIGWAVRTDDIDAAGRRIGMTPITGFRTADDGTEVTWRMLGVEVASLNPALPFFLEWQHDDRFAVREDPAHRIAPQEIAWIELCVDTDLIGSWLGEHDLPIRIVEGDVPGIRAVAIKTDAGEIVFD